MAASYEQSDQNQITVAPATSEQGLDYLLQNEGPLSQVRGEDGMYIPSLRVLVGATAGVLAVTSIMNGWISVEKERKYDIHDVVVGISEISGLTDNCWSRVVTPVTASGGYSEETTTHLLGWSFTMPGFTVPKIYEDMDAEIEHRYCSTPAAIKLVQGDDEKVHIKVEMNEENPVKVVSRLITPYQDAFESDSNFLGGNAGALESFLQGLPLPTKLTPHTVENIKQRLDWELTRAGIDAGVDNCADDAVEVGGEVMQAAVLDIVYPLYEQFAKVHEGEVVELTENDFVVDPLPTDPVFVKDYGTEPEKVDDVDDATITVHKDDDLACNVTDVNVIGETE